MQYVDIDEVALLLRAKRDSEWVEKNYDRLLKDYNNKFIAVKDNNVVAYDTSLENLINKIEKMRIAASETLIKFITKTTFVL